MKGVDKTLFKLIETIGNGIDARKCHMLKWIRMQDIILKEIAERLDEDPMIINYLLPIEITDSLRIDKVSTRNKNLAKLR